MYYKAYIDADTQRHNLKEAMREIEQATRDGKSGTARKVNRMAKEALK